MIDFDRRINEIVYVNDKGEEKFYKDVCHKFYDEYKDENVS